MVMKLQVPWRCFWPEPCDGFILHCDARLFRYRFFTPQVHKHKLLKPFGDGWIGYVSARKVGKAGFHLSLQLASMLVLLVLASLAVVLLAKNTCVRLNPQTSRMSKATSPASTLS